MTRLRWIPLLLLLAVAPPLHGKAGGGKVKFASAYTAVSGPTCKESVPANDGGDPVLRCPGLDPYYLTVNYAAIGMFASIEDGAGFTVRFQSDKVDGRVEWRLADGKAFAVIFRQVETDQGPQPKVIKEKLLVRGLRTHAAIQVEIDARGNRKANEEARQAADAAFLGAAGP